MISHCRSDQGATRIYHAVLTAAVAAAAIGAVSMAGGCDGAPEVLPDTETAAPAPASDAAPAEQEGGTAGAIAASTEPGARTPTLLDLGADKCVPCKMMAPVLDELRDTFAGQLAVVFIDVWKDRDAAREYQVSVIPTQIFLDAEGTELFRHQGYYSREDILAKWEELGYTFEE